MKLFKYLLPPKQWRFPVLILVGTIVGMGLNILYKSNALSYVSDAPETCVNCHIMAPQYATWNHSSHREVTTCNDCHVPQDNVFRKYFFKGKDGLGHATVFTMRGEPQVIKMKEAGIAVVQENCQRCHQHENENVGLLSVTREKNLHGEGKLCWECHREVPHGRVKSLSSTPNARVPLLKSPVPEWLDNLMEDKK
ncbi:cytochrome c nitrite reductase small subunit [Flexithrix dorotheae]|uniref:cytochrome c nitrite reductase small subunit n=1 Tax=Flexithrix dorotheae TaxID=70993 RepID=UPI00036EF42D|nr:cytochrome c nitrite reductase small subunit [Flexithrix dorotheae]